MEPIVLPDQLICGYFDCSVFAGRSASPERTRTLFEIEYYLEDGRAVFSNGISYPIKRSHVLIGCPNQSCHSLLPFKTKYLKFNAVGTLAACLSELPPYFPVRRPYEAERLLDEIISCQASKQPPLTLGAKLLAFLTLLCEDAYAAPPVTEANVTVARAKAFIDAHYAEPIKLTDMAAAVSLSPNYFHTLFTSTYRQTPHEYLIDCRIRAAKELLRLSSLPMSEIAEQCGFVNQQYLGTIFKRQTGVAPGQYRKHYRQNYLL